MNKINHLQKTTYASKQIGVCVICSLLFCISKAQLKTDAAFINILRSNKDSLFNDVLNNKDKYRLQIIYTKIDRDKNNKPSFTNYYFNNGYQLYFNPASTVKFPLALLSLEKLNKLNKSGVNKYTSMLLTAVKAGKRNYILTVLLKITYRPLHNLSAKLF